MMKRKMGRTRRRRGQRGKRNSIEQRPDVVSLADEEGVKQILTDSVLGLWDVVNNLTRLRPSRRERYRVTIFGSARAKPGTFAYEETKRLAVIGKSKRLILTPSRDGQRQSKDPMK
jgi:hypothetical protein